MKNIPEKLRMATLVVFLSTTMGISACSTGTGEGETNVEESDAKDRNPNEHNESGKQSQTATDTVDMDDAYEKTDPDKGVRDQDNDGMVDKPQ